MAFRKELRVRMSLSAAPIIQCSAIYTAKHTNLGFRSSSKSFFKYLAALRHSCAFPWLKKLVYHENWSGQRMDLDKVLACWKNTAETSRELLEQSSSYWHFLRFEHLRVWRAREKTHVYIPPLHTEKKSFMADKDRKITYWPGTCTGTSMTDNVKSLFISDFSDRKGTFKSISQTPIRSHFSRSAYVTNQKTQRHQKCLQFHLSSNPSKDNLHVELLVEWYHHRQW